MEKQAKRAIAILQETFYENKGGHLSSRMTACGAGCDTAADGDRAPQ